MTSCRQRSSGRPAWQELKIRVGTIRFFRFFQCRSSLTFFLPLSFHPIVRFIIEPELIHLESATCPLFFIVSLLEHKAWHIIVMCCTEVMLPPTSPLQIGGRCFLFWAFDLCWCGYGCQFLGLFVMFCFGYTLVWWVDTMLSLVKHKNTQGERLHVEKVSWFEVWSVLWHIIGVCDVGSETVPQLHT